jgi:hypothetical protein
MIKKVKRYAIKVLDSKKDLYGFVEALNNYFKDTPWGDMFYFETDGKYFYDKNEEYTYDFDIDWDTTVGEQIEKVASEYFGSKFDLIEPFSLTKLYVVLNDTKSFGDSGNQYEASKYKGKEWGVFARRSRAWVAFGTEKAMKEKAKTLNELDKQDSSKSTKDSDILTLTEYLEQEAETLERGLQDIDEESYLQDFHHHIWHKAEENGWDKDIVNKMLDYFETLENITVPEALRKASNYIYRSEHVFNFNNKNKEKFKDKLDKAFEGVNDSFKDGAINYKHSKDDMPSYGIDLRELEEYDDKEWMHDTFLEVEDLVDDANEKIKEKGYELSEDYYGDEVKLTVDPGYYEGFTMNIEVDGNTPEGLLEYAFGLMKEIAEETGLVKMKFGGWTGPVYLTDSEGEISIEEFNPSRLVESSKRRMEALHNEIRMPNGELYTVFFRARGSVSDPEDIEVSIVWESADRKNQEREISKDLNSYEEAIKFMEDWKKLTLKRKIRDSRKTLKDMNADQIINLINEAGAKGKSWGWLEGKLPEEFLYLSGKGGRLFPGQHDWRGTRELIHLTKPKSIEENVDFSWIPEYEEVKKELIPFYEKYGGKTKYECEREMEKAIQEEDSISKRALITADKDKFKTLCSAIDKIINNANLNTYISSYYSSDFCKRDFVFNKQKYLRELKNSYQNEKYIEGQKKPLITTSTPGKNYISSKDDKVEPLTTEAEAYIRRILKETDTEEIKEKKNLRRSRRYNSNSDILSVWQNERRKLKELLRKLKELESRGTIRGISYRGPRQELVYKEGGPYDYKGNWVGSKGNYVLTGKMTKPSANIEGVDTELQKPLSEAIARAFSANSVSELKTALSQALEAVEFLPDDSTKIQEAKQNIVDFIEQHQRDLNLRKEGRVKRLPDSKNQGGGTGSFIYLFPMEGLTKRDLEIAKDYNLTYLGKNFFQGERNYVVSGSRTNLVRYAKDYLAYELHPDYLYREDEFAGKIV